MDLNSILVSEFAKITNDDKQTTNEGATVYGTYRVDGDGAYVQIDGSDTRTPVATTSEARNGDRVTVLIKNHRAIITGNLTDPSASTKTVQEINTKFEGDLDTLISEISYSLLSAGPGYMQFIDQSGNAMTEIKNTSLLSGFRIMDTQTLTDSTKGWLANKNGIGWSSDGFKTISKIGLDMINGRIYADEITAGSVITNSFKIGDSMSFNGDTGAITFGSNVSMNWNNITNQPYILDNTDVANIVDNELESSNVVRYTQISGSNVITQTLEATNLILTGGSVNISASSENDNRISLYYGPYSVNISPYNITLGGSEIYSDSIVNGDSFVQSDGFYNLNGKIDVAKAYLENPSSTSSSANVRRVNNTYQLCVSTEGSLRKLKHDIKPVEDSSLAPEKLYDVEVVQFKYNQDYLSNDNDCRYDKNLIGFIVDDMINIYPIAVDLDENGDMETWNARYIIPPMLALIQKQKKKLDELESRINALEKKEV